MGGEVERSLNTMRKVGTVAERTAMLAKATTVSFGPLLRDQGLDERHLRAMRSRSLTSAMWPERS